MDALLGLLLLAAIVGLVWALVAPKTLAKHSKKNLTRKHFGLGFGGLIIVLLIVIGVTAPKQPANQTVQLTSKNGTSTSKPTVTTNTVTQTKAIPFSSTNVNDSSVAQGTNKVTTAGVEGTETLTYQDTYSNGKQTAQKLVSDVVTTQPVTQVTSIGTYVAPAPAPSPAPNCTNGTYVNSAGNTVCSPEPSPSAPAGATAQCVDGTYSFSQSRSGTCSHHGGVAQWL